MRSLLTSLTFACALVMSSFGQAPPLIRNPFTTNAAGGGLTNLSDVVINRAAITDGEVLTWDNTTGKWINEPATGGIGSGVVGNAGVTNATRVSLIQGLLTGTNVFRTLFGSNGITVINQGTNISVEISDPELLVWSSHTTNTFVRTNDTWLLRFASNGVALAGGTAIGVANASSGIQQLWTVSVTDAELLIWATHTTNTFVRTNDLWLDRVASNRIVLAEGPGIQINTVAVGNKQVSTISATGGEGSISSSNVTIFGNFGYMARGDLVVTPYAPNGAFVPVTGYNSFSGSNFTGDISLGFITNRCPGGWVTIDASVNLTEGATVSGNLSVAIFVNSTQVAITEILNDDGDSGEYSLQAAVNLLTNDVVSVRVRNTDVQAVTLQTAYLRVVSMDHRFTVVSGGGSLGQATLSAAGGIIVEDQGTNFFIYLSNITAYATSDTVTNIGNGAVVSMVWDGPNVIRWGPTNNGILTGGGTAPPAGGPAKTWTLEVYPGGYTNLLFPGAFTWIDGGPYYNRLITNIFELKFTGSNFVAFTRPNAFINAASVNVSGHWIAPPPSGEIGGKNGSSQIRTNLLASNTMLVISNLINETEVEIWSRGPIATISNATSIQWLEGSQPYISTNGRTLLRFWMADGVTNGMVLSQQIVDFVAGNDIDLTTDMPNNRVTIHSTATGGGGGSGAPGLVTGVDANQLEVNSGVLSVKPGAVFSTAINKGNFTVQPDDDGSGGGLGAAYFSSFRYMDIGVTNLGSAHIVTMVWDGPSWIRWSPTNNGALTGGGMAPQSGDPARKWEVEILPNGATNITWPGAFQWTDGGPYFDRLRTNVYSIVFNSSNYTVRRTSPGFRDFLEQGTNTVLYTNPTTGRLVINASAAGGGTSSGTGNRKLVEHFVGGNTTNIGSYGWQPSTTGTVPTKTGASSDPGTVQLTTSGVLSNWSTIFLGPGGEFGTLTNYPWTNAFFVTVPGATYFTNMTFRAGFTAGVNDFTNSGYMIALVFTNGSAIQGPGNWFGVMAVNSVETITNTGISSGTVQTFTNEIRSTGNGLIRFAVNGVESAAIGGGPNISMRPFFSITTTEAAAKLMNVQYWNFDWVRDYPGQGTSGGALGLLNYSESGTSGLFLNGNVGIGTTNPLQKFVVSSAGAEGFEVAPSGGNVLLQSYDRSGFAYTPLMLSGSTVALQVGGVTKMFLDTSGKVGIGTANPFAKLDIGTSSEEVIRTSFVSDFTYYHSILGGYSATPTNNYLAFKINNGTSGVQTEVMRLVGDGRVHAKKLHLTDGTILPGSLLAVDAQTNLVAASAASFPYVIREEFFGGSGAEIGTHGWFSLGGAPAYTGIAGRLGVVTLLTGTALADVSALSIGLSATIFTGLTNTPFTNKMILALSGSSSFTNCTLRAGWGDAITSPINPANGIFFSVTNLALTSGNWFGILAIGGTETIVDIGVSSATVNYVTNELRHTGNGQITFAVNGVASAPIAGAPPNPGRPLFSITKTEAIIDTGAKSATVDYWELAPAMNR